MFTSLGDLVGTAGDEAIDSLVASIAPVRVEAREVRGELVSVDFGYTEWPELLDEANALDEAIRASDGDEDVALDMLGEEYGMWPEGPRW